MFLLVQKYFVTQSLKQFLVLFTLAHFLMAPFLVFMFCVVVAPKLESSSHAMLTIGMFGTASVTAGGKLTSGTSCGVLEEGWSDRTHHRRRYVTIWKCMYVHMTVS